MLGGTGNLFGQKPGVAPGAQQTPTFGSPAAPGGASSSFGTSAQSPFGGAVRSPFGAATTAAVQPFGTPTNTNPQQQQPALNFGFPAQNTTASTGFSFPQQSQAPGTGFKINTTSQPLQQQNILRPTLTPKTTATAPGLSFGTTTTTAQPALNFGLGSNLTKTTPSFGFGSTTPSTTPSTGLTFGLGTTTTTTQAAPAPTLNFGLGSIAATAATTSAAPTPTLNFGLGSTLTPATTQSTGLTFGPGLSTTPGTGFGLPTTTTTAVATAPPNFGLGIAPTATTVQSQGLGVQSQPSATTHVGVNPLSSLSTLNAQRTKKPELSKDRPVPPELIQSIESLREFVKQQKAHSSEVSQASLKPILKVSDDAEILKRMTVQLEREVSKNRVQNKKLRSDLARSIQDCEIVQRLSANQRGFPCDNSIAFHYFQNIIDRFQSQAETLSSELKNMERHVTCRLNPVPFTPEELSISMKRLYECFVALAGRYQAIHSSITALKLEVKRRKEPYK